MVMELAKNNKNWKNLRLFLPKGWTSKAKQCGAFSRKRGFKSVNVLLRTLLIHLVNGCSLKETVVRAEQGGICKVSSVALSKRLKKSGEWFNWMSLRLMQFSNKNSLKTPSWLKKYVVKSVDASVISEQGSTGTNWRLHYSMSLFDLRADQYYLTSPKSGETIRNFAINPGELWIGDRAYCSFKQLQYITDHEADFIVRYKTQGVSLYQSDKKFDLIKALKKLKHRDVGHWIVEGRSEKEKRKTNHPIRIRICAIRKSEEMAEKSMKGYKKAAQKKGKTFKQSTLELHKYTIILTSLPERISKDQVMELYRIRWQIEIAFKRMKSLLGLGQLPKKDPQVCLSWLEGKMFVSLLLETLLEKGGLFSPWGYPLSRL